MIKSILLTKYHDCIILKNNEMVALWKTIYVYLCIPLTNPLFFIFVSFKSIHVLLVPKRYIPYYIKHLFIWIWLAAFIVQSCISCILFILLIMCGHPLLQQNDLYNIDTHFLMPCVFLFMAAWLYHSPKSDLLLVSYCTYMQRTQQRNV